MGGAGFLEKVYQRTLLRELKLQGIQAESQVHFSVIYWPERGRFLCRHNA